MIYRNNKEAIGIYYLGRSVSAMYHLGQLVWQAVRSCFGSGVWVSAKPWLGSEKWKNHK